MPIESQRIKYQRIFAQGKIVNLGCGENPCQFGDDAVHVDIDIYNHKNFVQADIHNLPFKDDEFDTAVMGDVLEHCYDPIQALREAGRVAKKVVATVFEEWRLVPGGIEKQIENKYQELKKLGFDNEIDYFNSLESHKGKIVSITSDYEIVHHPHLHQFTDDSLKKIIDDAGLDIIIFYKYPEGETEGRIFYNWLLVLKKK